MGRSARPAKAGKKRAAYFNDQDFIFLRRLIVTLAVAGLAYFLWRISGILLLLFGAVLIAVLLRAFADFLERHLPLAPYGLTVATLVCIALLGGFLFLFGANAGQQFSYVVEKIPRALDIAGERFGIYNLTGEIERAVKGDSDGSGVMWQAATIGYAVLGGVFDFILVVIAAIYLAADPRLYRRGVVKLFPPDQHELIFDAMDTTGGALRLWFWAQLLTMFIVAAMSLAAYWWIGLPSPLALALIAGVTNFIPYLGPFLGAVPAIIFAFTMDTDTIIWTVVAIVVIQQIEGNILTPLIQDRIVLMPAVLVLFSIVVFGFLFGVWGVVLAVPLAVALAVLIKKLWMRDVLGEHTVVPGEKRAASQR